MFFGADIFVPEIEFFGGITLEIPDNLFDIGILFFFGNPGPVNYENYGDFYGCFDRIFNFDIHAGFILDSIGNYSGEFNEFPDSRNFLLENYGQVLFFPGDLVGFYGSLFCDPFENLCLSNGFTRGFADAGNFFSGFALTDGSGFYFPRSFTEKNNQSFDFRQFFLRSFESLLDFSGIKSEIFGNFFEAYGYFFRDFSELLNSPEFFTDDREKIIVFPNIRSEKISGSVEFLQDYLPGFERIPTFCEPYYLTKTESPGIMRKIIQSVPENIYTVSAGREFNERIVDILQKNSGEEVTSSILKRRIDELEEKIVRGQSRCVYDYDQVVRRLEFDLRSALNSCCEGVHF